MAQLPLKSLQELDLLLTFREGLSAVNKYDYSILTARLNPLKSFKFLNYGTVNAFCIVNVHELITLNLDT
ncbi:MAG: hypothetical protein QXF63_04955 [Sulfolobales archaeon]